MACRSITIHYREWRGPAKTLEGGCRQSPGTYLHPLHGGRVATFTLGGETAAGIRGERGPVHPLAQTDDMRHVVPAVPAIYGQYLFERLGATHRMADGALPFGSAQRFQQQDPAPVEGFQQLATRGLLGRCARLRVPPTVLPGKV